MSKILPRYPVYVISKGRADVCLTARFLVVDGCPFKLVVEPQEEAAYRKLYGDRVVTLPFSNLGLGSIPARNWVWEDAKAAGFARHWILDDNIYRVRRLVGRRRIPCEAGPAFACVEDFADRYTNLALAGLNYAFFVVPSGTTRVPPFWHNVHCYSTILIQNDLPFRWRGRYNEDTDLSLQVLSAGLCTALINTFMIQKVATMVMKGGNTAELYKGDGRLRMARSLEQQWPGVVTVRRRFKRPQHVIKNQWRGFDTPLIWKPGVEKPTGANEYGMVLRELKAPKSAALRALVDVGTERRR